MNRFWEVLIKPVLELCGAKNIVEIGAQTGRNTQMLLEYVSTTNGRVYSIDPAPVFPVQEWIEQYGDRFVFLQELSLSALPLIENYDAILIDGDHNWYTVYNELKIIERTFKTGDTFPIIFLHDIGWPYGKRDLYYNPDNIPPAFLQPYKKMGIKPGELSLIESGLNAHLNNAIYENNPRNGVLTAVEDFLEKTKFNLRLEKIEGFHGLGIIIPDSPKYNNVMDFLSNKSLIVDILKLVEEERLIKQIEISNIKQNINHLKKQISDLTILKESLESNIDIQKLNFKEELEKCKSMHQEELEKTIEQLEEAHQEKLEKTIEIIEKNTKEELEKTLEELEVEIDNKENLIDKKQKKLLELEESRKSISNKIQSLKKTLEDTRKELRQTKKEVNIHLNSIRYRLGDILISSMPPSKDTLKAPYRIYKLLIEGFRKKRGIIDSEIHSQNDIEINGIHHKNNHPETTTTKDIYSTNNKIDIVICVHNALEDVKTCLYSIIAKKTLNFNLILVDDGSDNDTKDFLVNFSKAYDCLLIRNEKAKGYTVAANQGLSLATSKYCVLLNSDTIVTYRWLEKMIDCMESSGNVGIVGPLSNAASWQSIPKVKDGNDWAVNNLGNMSVEEMATIVEKVSKRVYPEVPFVNGFCFMIHRKVIDKVKFLDEATFPTGYGEENDYCIRARAAGFTLKIDDSSYIYHQKSKSFTHEKRRELAKNARSKLINKHGKELLDKDVSNLSENKEMLEIRDRINNQLQKIVLKEYKKMFLYYLSSR